MPRSLVVHIVSKLFEIVKAHLLDMHPYSDICRLNRILIPTGLRPCVLWRNVLKISVLGWQGTSLSLMMTNRNHSNWLDKVTIAQLNIRQAIVPIISSTVRNLGSWFDVNFEMTTQINKACQSVYYHLQNIRQIRKLLTPASSKLHVQGLIMTCHASVTTTAFNMVYQQCVFPNYNVFRILQRDLSPTHLNTVI